MPYDAVFVFDSSYPSVDIAVPIDDERPHVIVSNRRIEPPPGHSCLLLDKEANLASIFRNLRSLRIAWTDAKGEKCIVIAAIGVRPEQLLLNTIYAFFLSRNVALFDGSRHRSILPFWQRLLKGAFVHPVRRLLGGLKLKLATARFKRRVRTLPAYLTREGRLFGLYTSSHSFSLPPDKVTLLPDGRSLYGNSTREWYLPAFSNRRQRYSVQTTRHRLCDVTLHVEKANGLEVSSLFKDGRILDCPYMLGSARSHYRYPVSTRGTIKTIARGINLLAYVSGYYHWLIEGVPRILDLIDDGLDFDQYPLLMPPLDLFQRQTLEVLGIIPDRHVITVEVGDWCHVGECIFPTPNFPFGWQEIEDPSGQPDYALLTRIRARLMECITLVTPAIPNPPKKLYISRAKARARKFAVETEAAVSSVLEGADFQTVYLEDLPWPAQVRLVAGAECIAGLHGAGLTNILFANAKTLLEFHNPLETRAYFAVMARELDIRYTSIIGALQGYSPKFNNITIDLQTLTKMVAGLI